MSDQSQLPMLGTLRQAYRQLFLHCWYDRHPWRPQGERSESGIPSLQAPFALSLSKRSFLGPIAMVALCAGLMISAPVLAKKDSIEARLDRLEAENRYLRDYLDIWKVQSLYAHYWNINAPHEIVALFADSSDVEIELSNKGVIKGRDAPRRYYLRAGTLLEIKDTVPPRRPGSLVLHTAVNPVIEINRDGTRAKAVWLSPGITNFTRDGEMIAAWNYGKYEMEYLKQNGAWKILAFRWRQMFLSPYDKGWAKENIDPGAGGGGAQKPDRASVPAFYNPYRVDKTNPFDPPPPVPYRD